MTTEHWQTVLETFERIYFDTPIERREAELSRLCGGRKDLEEEVRRMLASAEVPGPLDSPVVCDPAELIREDSAPGFFYAGRRLGNRFRLIRLLGEGGMGQIWEAFDEQLEARRALKTLRPEIASDRDMIARFKREVERAQAVTHPNVCRVHDLNFDGAVPYLSMELIEGETLSAWLRRGPQEEEQIWRVLQQCAAGIDAAHAAGLVHRDLKPANVMVVSGAGELRAVVMDFGLAFHAAPGSTGQISLLGSGTPAYMAPEQAEGGTPTAAADIYSFGIIACEALTGKRPSDGGLAALPGRRRDVIRHCLDIDPSRRPSSAQAFVSRLDGRAQRRRFLGAGIGATLCAAGAGWALRMQHGAPAAGEASIAILPFEIAGGAADPNAVGEGIADGVVALLTRTPRLRVIPRASSEALAHAAGKLEEFANRARARYLVTGRVRVGDRIALSAEIVEVASNRTVWAGTFDETEANLPDMERKLAETVLAQIGLPSGFSDWSPRRTLPEATRAYRIGRHHLNQRSSESLRKAREYFESAMRLDAGWAEPRVGLAQVLIIQAERQDEPPLRALPAARELIVKAIALDPRLAEAHAGAGFLAAGYEHDFNRAETEFRRAIDLDPDNVLTRQWHAYTLIRRAEIPAALRESDAALDLDPLSAAAHQSHAAILVYARDWQRLFSHLEKLAELHPNSYYYRILRAYAFAQTGQAQPARTELAQAMTNPPAMALRMAGEIQALLGDRAAAAAMVQELETRRRSGTAVPSSYIGFLQAAIGNRDEAFRWLEQAWSEGDTFLTLLRVYPGCDPLRGDPRYQSLIARLGL